MSTQQLFIDVDKIIKGKNPTLYKALPRFVINYIKRILHQDELNYILGTYGHTEGLDFIDNTLNYLKVTHTIRNIENIPTDNGRYIFVSNHPLGGLDGLVLMQAIGQHYNTIKFIVNDLLLNLKPFDNIFVPVNKHGRQTAEYAQFIENVYRSDNQILYFPAGVCSRKIKGKIIDLDWKKSFISKSIEYQRNIIPIHFAGRNSNFFYNLSNFRKFIGIKSNVEMFYLSDELFKQKNKNFELIIGETIPYTVFDKSRNYAQWAKFVSNKVYELAR